jgi:ring-1,2-phenylacetyl-CoA epoxidase subunit PaaD
MKKVSCPYCSSTSTELYSLFGQQLLTVQYYCQSCHTPFEYVKDDDTLNHQGVAHIADAAGHVAQHNDAHVHRKEEIL